MNPDRKANAGTESKADERKRVKPMHIWTIENWRDVLNYESTSYRTGVRLVFDKDVDPELRLVCKHFAVWMRKEYNFPIRVPVYFRNTKRLRCIDGSTAYGTYFEPTSFTDEPYIQIAVGDYGELCQKIGSRKALLSILRTIAHELTHYFQWINGLQLTEIGKERQATVYSNYIVSEYLDWIQDVNCGLAKLLI